jgi:hypothetical protein
MSDLWFGPDGYLDLSALADGDPDSIPPFLPSDELEALHEAISASSITTTPWGRFGRALSWDTLKMGFGPGEADHGDALAAAMGGAHLEIATTSDDTTLDLDDLIDPWAGVPAAYAYGGVEL